MPPAGEKAIYVVCKIESDKLTLIPFDTTDNSHCEFLVTLWNTPLFISSSGKTGIDTTEKAKAFIERRWTPSYALNGYGNYIVALNNNNNDQLDFIGTVGLTLGDTSESYIAPDLGFAILPEFNGKGYATAASKMLLEHVRKELGIVEVFGFCDPKNGGSRKVLQKAGLEFRGLKKLSAFGGDEGAVYAMLRMDKDLNLYGIKE